MKSILEFPIKAVDEVLAKPEEIENYEQKEWPSPRSAEIVKVLVVQKIKTSINR